jgi:hypothetical protein
MRRSSRKAGDAQAILQHQLSLECGNNVATIRQRFATPGVSQRGRKCPLRRRKIVQNSDVLLLSENATSQRRPCDGLATPP